MIARNAALALLVSLAIFSPFACGSGSGAPSTASNQAISASSVPSLGAAANFAILAGTAVTCTGGTVSGDVGVYPGSAITNTGCTITGALHPGDAAAAQAHNDFALAYDAFAALPCDHASTEVILATQTLAPGVYCFSAALTSTDAVLTLDGPADGVWIFKVGTAGTGALTGTRFSVILQNGAACGNVYWWAAEAVTMTDSNLVGTVLAGAATTFTNGTSSGEALAKAGITLTGTAAVNACAPGGSGGDAGSPPPVCRANDFVTGGGWIDPAPSGAKATFAVSGGIKKGEFWGHLTYEDHGKKGVSIKSESVTAYTVIDATTRRIEGAASVDGKKGFTYQADVSDNGEPGRKDRFTLRLSSGYGASGLLQGGNIQLHRGHDRACNGDDDEDEDDHGDHEDHGDKGDHGHGKGDHR